MDLTLFACSTFEEAIEAGSGDDPLAIWIRFDARCAPCLLGRISRRR